MLLNGLLQILSFFYLAFVVAMVLGMNETDDWHVIMSSTIRRWTKLILAMAAIAIGVQILGN